MKDVLHPSNRYPGGLQALHWTTAILVLLAFTLGPGGSEQQIYSVEMDLGRRIHETLGVTVFALTAIRLGLRLANPRTPAANSPPQWLRVAAKVGHAGLYVLLFSVPSTAILGAWLGGHPVTLLTGIDVSSPFATARVVGQTLAELHPWLGDAIIWLAGMHAVAALGHHFLLHDSTLLKMLPAWLPVRERGRQTLRAASTCCNESSGCNDNHDQHSSESP
ncbi:MAG: cytochrome b [Burkholderiaceae bacterium]